MRASMNMKSFCQHVHHPPRRIKEVKFKPSLSLLHFLPPFLFWIITSQLNVRGEGRQTRHCPTDGSWCMTEYEGCAHQKHSGEQIKISSQHGWHPWYFRHFPLQCMEGGSSEQWSMYACMAEWKPVATNAGKGKEALLRWLNAFCARSYPHSVALLLAAKGNRKQREILPYVVDPI